MSVTVRAALQRALQIVGSTTTSAQVQTGRARSQTGEPTVAVALDASLGSTTSMLAISRPA